MNTIGLKFGFIVMVFFVFAACEPITVNAQSLLSEDSQKAEVIVTSHKYVKHTDSNFDDLVGQVKNIGNGTAQSIQIIFTYYDNNGDVIGTDGVYIDTEKLNPAQKAPFLEFRDNNSTSSEMAYYEIGLKWNNPDGSEEYVENALVKEKKSSISNTNEEMDYSNNKQLSSDFSDINILENSKGQFVETQTPNPMESSIQEISKVNESITSTKKWLEYTNPIYGFSLEYPEDWKVIEGNRFKNTPGLIVSTNVTTTDINQVLNNYTNYNTGLVIYGQISISHLSSITLSNLNKEIYEHMMEQFAQNDGNIFSNWQIFEITSNKRINNNDVDAISAVFLIGDPIKDKFSLVLESLFIPFDKKLHYFIFIGNPDTFDQRDVLENRQHILNSIKVSNFNKIQTIAESYLDKDQNFSNQQKEYAVLQILEGAATMGNPNYYPKELTIKKNQTILVNNTDAMPHTVTNGDGPSDSTSGKIFDTSIINGGESKLLYTENIDLGIYKYYCTVHPYMSGFLKVE